MPASTESANSAEMMIFMTLSPCVIQAEEMAGGHGDNGSVLGRKLCCKSHEVSRWSSETHKGINAMLDTITPVTQQITRLIIAGVVERDLLAAVARQFPDLTRTEFVAALQDATAQVEQRALR